MYRHSPPIDFFARRQATTKEVPERDPRCHRKAASKLRMRSKRAWVRDLELENRAWTSCTSTGKMMHFEKTKRMDPTSWSNLILEAIEITNTKVQAIERLRK